jgi:signal transduction histidine kinase
MTSDTLDPAPPARRSHHPLELFPFFATRFAPGPARDFVYTFIFNTLIGLVFTALALMFSDRVDLGRQLFVTFVFAQCIGYTIYLLMSGFFALVPAARGGRTMARWIGYTVVPVIGVFIGYWIAATVLDARQSRAEMFTPRGMAAIAAVAVVIAGILVAIFASRERAARAPALAAREEARANAAEKEATLARMQLLEAQVEPHFLYNTLAHVVSLVDAEPPLAKRMLHRLIDLLRATAASASARVTLGRELDLVRAYLDLIAMRMGPRLAWSIDAPADLAGVEVPPMLLQPVVENAIKHGLEPNVSGGRVDVRARREDGALVLTVTDTGVGVAATRRVDSTGVGLANLRARLAATFDGAATLRLADHAPSGTEVTISIPLR